MFLYWSKYSGAKWVNDTNCVKTIESIVILCLKNILIIRNIHTVGFPSCRLNVDQAILFLILSLSGSTCAANFRFCKVYSWPQNTLVSLGRFPRISMRALCICSAVPSKNLPQPPKNNVSPVRSCYVLLIMLQHQHCQNI